jgi:hypothetical protein
MSFSRRSFLFRTSAGAAAIGALAIAPKVLGAPPAAEAAESRSALRGAASPDATARATAGPVVVHLRDAERGEIAIYTGTREVIVRDHNLVSTILGAL